MIHISDHPTTAFSNKERNMTIPDIPLRPLAIVKNIIEAMGLDISYAYDDLIFVEHNAFLLQMSNEKGEDVGVWFNQSSNPEDRPTILSQLQEEGRSHFLNMTEQGLYSIDNDEANQSFQLKFIDTP